MYHHIIWDFDGTLIPFDSEQFLLETLPLRGLRSTGARLFVYGDRQGWHPGMLKVLYGWSLRGTTLTALDRICAQIAAHIDESDRAALHSLAARGPQMTVLSCGTAALSRGTLRAAGLSDAFVRVEANRLFTQNGQITGIERRFALPETKVKVAARHGISWKETIVVGDGLTDVPILDRAGLPILIARGEKATRFAARGYEIVPSLSRAIERACAAIHTAHTAGGRL
jgi:phosphoserine phosphatase